MVHAATRRYSWPGGETPGRDRDSNGVMIGGMTYELGRGTGPLAGVKVVEIAGIGPGPHACMILADLGADVIRIDRPGGGMFGSGQHDVLDPRSPERRARPEAARGGRHRPRPRRARRRARRGHAPRSDRAARPGPGGLSRAQPAPRVRPDDRLGPGRAVEPGGRARHELHRHHRRPARARARTASRPHFPGNLLGDFGGGSTYLVIGVLAALLEARLSGRGQVVDAAIVDGTAHLNAMAATFAALGMATGTGAQRACSTAARPTTTSTRPPTAAT